MHQPQSSQSTQRESTGLSNASSLTDDISQRKGKEKKNKSDFKKKQLLCVNPFPNLNHTLEKAGYESCRQIYTVKKDFHCSGVKGSYGTVLRSAFENNQRIMNFYDAKTLAASDFLDAITKENMKVSF
nr:uncharacterized protein LOC109185792 [Ipomoea batatas]